MPSDAGWAPYVGPWQPSQMPGLVLPGLDLEKLRAGLATVPRTHGDRPVGWAVTDDGHHIWAGKIIRGRPMVYAGGTYVATARHLWEKLHGAILGRHQVRRVCSAGACVSPHHHVVRGYAKVARQHGRKHEEVIAICHVMTSKYADRMRWSDDTFCPAEVVTEIATRLSSPPILVHAAFSRLVQLGVKHRMMAPTDHDASEASIERAKAMVTGEKEVITGGWLPPLPEQDRM